MPLNRILALQTDQDRAREIVFRITRIPVGLVTDKKDDRHTVLAFAATVERMRIVACTIESDDIRDLAFSLLRACVQFQQNMYDYDMLFAVTDEIRDNRIETTRRLYGLICGFCAAAGLSAVEEVGNPSYGWVL